MSFNWKKYLSLATTLSETDKEEYIRTSIGRAYYSLFKIIVLKSGYNTLREQRTQKDFHKKLASDCKNPSEKLILKLDLEKYDIIIIGNILDELRIKRNKADYDGLEKFTQKNAKDAVEKVNEVFGMFEGNNIF